MGKKNKAGGRESIHLNDTMIKSQQKKKKKKKEEGGNDESLSIRTGTRRRKVCDESLSITRAMSLQEEERINVEDCH